MRERGGGSTPRTAKTRGAEENKNEGNEKCSLAHETARHAQSRADGLATSQGWTSAGQLLIDQLPLIVGSLSLYCGPLTQVSDPFVARRVGWPIS